MIKTITLLLSGILALSLLQGCEKKETRAYSPQPLTVDTMSVAATDEPRLISILGRAEGGKDVEIRSQVTGLIRKVHFSEGAFVRKGDLLYTIEEAPFKADLDVARALRREANEVLLRRERDAQRNKKLFLAGSASKKLYDDAVTELNAARAKLELARAKEKDASIKLEWTSITAPTDGFTGKALLNPGALVTEKSSLLTTLTQHDDIRVIFAPSERTLDGARISLQNHVFLTDERGNRYDAKLDFVSPSVSPTTGARLMRAKVLNADGLSPGDFIRVTLMTGVRKHVYRIPQKLIRQEPDGTYSVFAVEEGKAVLKTVTVDRWDGPDWIVTDGLKDNDRLITSKLLRVRAGHEVLTEANGSQE